MRQTKKNLPLYNIRYKEDDYNLLVYKNFILACIWGDDQKVEDLISHVDVNKYIDISFFDDFFSLTPLHYINNVLEIFNNITYVSPLIIAIKCSRYRTMEMLIDSMAIIDYAIIYVLCCYGDDMIFDIFIQSGGNFKSYVEQYKYSTIWASYYNNESMVKNLINIGQDVNSKNHEGCTPLTCNILGINSDNTRDNLISINIINILLKNGADINCKCNKGLTPLYYSISRKNYTISKTLIQLGADVNYFAKMTPSPLIQATRNNMVDLVKCLLENGAQIDAMDDEDKNALMYACIIPELYEVLKILLEHGCDINASNKDPNTAALFACGVNNIKALSLLLNFGLDINKRYEEGSNLLMLSIIRNNNKLTRFLIERGAEVNAINDFGMSALSFACLANNYDGIKLLIHNGADIEKMDIYGYKPVTLARLLKNEKIEDFLDENLGNESIKGKNKKYRKKKNIYLRI